MLTLKQYVDNFEIGLKRFLIAGLLYTVSLSSIRPVLSKLADFVILKHHVDPENLC